MTTATSRPATSGRHGNGKMTANARWRLATALPATRSELKRLGRRSFAGVGLALLAFFSALASVVAFVAAEQTGPAGPGFGTDIDLASSQGLVAGLNTAADICGIIVLALWASAAASDYSTGWIRILVQAEPRRWRLLGGKLLALAGYTLVGTAGATALAVAIAPALAGAAGISTAAWSNGAAGTILSAWLNLTLAVLVWGVIGVAIATVTRSVAAAIAGGVGYMMVVEGLLGRVFDAAAMTYFPGSVLRVLAGGGTESLSYATAAALGLGYAAAAITIAGATFVRRDITS